MDMRAEQATRVLRRLGDPISKFWYHEADQKYCLTVDTGGSYLTLNDHGYWFNLDYLGRKDGPQPLEKILGPTEVVGS